MADVEMRDRIQSESKAIVRVTNADLVCRDCVMRYPDDVILGNTSRCESYPACKPGKILLGGGCPNYVKE